MINFRKWAWEIDKLIFSLIVFLEFLGLLTVLRLSFIMSSRFNASYDMIFFLKHLIFVGGSLVMMFVFSYVSWKTCKRICLIIFFVALCLNFATVIIGTKINGVKRWIWLFGFSLQSSEFVKTLIVVPVASFLSRGEHKKTMVLLSVCAISCLIQPDLGMTFLITSSTSCLVFLKGENFKNYIKILALVFVGLILSGLFLTKYFANRLMIFLGQKEGFQISQSLKLFASSKFVGQDINEIYVPDSHCDFMFAEIVSGFGFLVGIIVILIPLVFYFKAITKIKGKTEEDKMIAMGILNQFAIQTFFHVLSNLALIPTKGLNLPFASVGGSAILAHGIAMGVVLNLFKKTMCLR